MLKMSPSQTRLRRRKTITTKGPFEQGLHKMTTTLEEGIDAMQSNKASTQGQPHDPTETTILIQAAQTQLAALL